MLVGHLAPQRDFFTRPLNGFRTRSTLTPCAVHTPSLSFKRAVARKAFLQGVRPRNLARLGRVVTSALFEKFTERSIKSVMLSQSWARDMSDSEVRDF